MNNVKRAVNDVFYEIEASSESLRLAKNTEVFKHKSLLYKIAQKDIFGKARFADVLLSSFLLSSVLSFISLFFLLASIIDQNLIEVALLSSGILIVILAITLALNLRYYGIVDFSAVLNIDLKNFESLEEIEGFSESFIEIVKGLDDDNFVQFFTDLEQLSKDSTKIEELEKILSFQEKTYNNEFRLDAEKKLKALLSTKEAILTKHDQVVHKAIEKSLENKTLTLISE